MVNGRFVTELTRMLWGYFYSPAARYSRLKGGGQWDVRCQSFCNQSNILIQQHEWECTLMNGRRNKGFVQNVKFVDVELTSEGKAAFKEWEWSDEDTIAYIERMGTEGYKFGTRYDSTNGTWIASLTCAQEKHENYGWCLSARGRSWLHAAAVVAYKDMVLLGSSWAAGSQLEDNDANWG